MFLIKHLIFKRLSELYSHLKHCVQVSQQNEILAYASALAFNTILSIIPLIAISFLILYQIPWIKSYSLDTLNYSLEMFDFVDSNMAEYLQKFASAMLKMSHVYLLFWFLTNVMLFSQIQFVLDRIFRCEKSRSFILVTIISTLLAMLLPFLLLSGTIFQQFFSQYIPKGQFFHSISSFPVYLVCCLFIYKIFFC